MSNNNTEGGSAQKQKSNPKFKDVDKVGVVVVGVPNPAPPNQTDLVSGKDYNATVDKLKINKQIIGLKNIEEELIEDESLSTVKIRSNSDLVEAGIVKQIPALQEQQRKKDDLHRWHNKVTNSFRVKKVIEKLYEEQNKNELELLVSTLENVSTAIRSFKNT